MLMEQKNKMCEGEKTGKMQTGTDSPGQAMQIIEETATKIGTAKEEGPTGEEQFVIFSIGAEEFGVSISEVLEITRLKDITRVPNGEDFIEGVINLRGRIHVVINLAKKLGLPQKGHDDETRIMIVELSDDRVGMIVDTVTEVLKVDNQNIKAAPELISRKVNSDYITGVAIIGRSEEHTSELQSH